MHGGLMPPRSAKTGKRMENAMKDTRETNGPDGAYRKDYAEEKTCLPLIALLIACACLLALCAARYTPEEDALSGQIRLWMNGEEEHGVPVAPVMDIEDVWAIEDTRTEAEDALVRRMFNGDDVLGYDSESRTFYCTIGTDNGDEWPELALSALGEAGVSAAFVDDYSYDFCWDAVAEGYTYELLTYTDTEYAYASIVFTGMPIVTIHAEAEIEWGTDVGADIHIAGGGEDALYSHALIHKRGGNAYVGVPKDSYRIEFRGITPKGKERAAARGVLGMEADSDWLLIGNASDYLAIRNHLCWQLWRDWKEGPQFGELESRLVELFRGDEYMGIYQLMQYVNPEKELVRMGANPKTDVVARLIITMNEGDRPRKPRKYGHDLELRYVPEGMTTEEAFAIFAPFEEAELPFSAEIDEEAFTALIETNFDTQELLDYFLFIQLYGMRDNAWNNLFVWAIRQEDGTYRYSFSPWDMDRSLGYEESTQRADELATYDFGMAFHMLNLDLMNSRERMWAMFEEKRAGALSDENLYNWMYAVEDEINATGAYLRESEKWRGGAQKLDVYEMYEKTVGFQYTFQEIASWMWPIDGMDDAQE